MTLTRRDFVRTSVSAAAALALPPLPMLERAQTGTRIMKRIPVSGEEIPAVGLGSSVTFDLFRGSPDYAAAVEVVKLFREQGGKVIDTAPAYGRAETFVGEAMQSLNIANDVFLATKLNVGAAPKSAAFAQMEESSRRFGRKTIDLMQVWNLGDSRTALTDRFLDAHMDWVKEWKAAGRARYIGITTMRDPQYADVEAALKKYTLDFVQLDYSVEDRICDQRLIPTAKDRGVAVLVNRPFTAGNIFRRIAGRPVPSYAAEIDCTTWAQVLLKFVISHPAVTCAIPATGDPKHLRDNMAACYGRLPDDAMRKRIIATFDSL